jgi:hypothetical protein
VVEAEKAAIIEDEPGGGRRTPGVAKVTVPRRERERKKFQNWAF